MQERKEDNNNRKKNITVMKVQKEIFESVNPNFEKKKYCAKFTLNERIWDKTTETQSITFTETDFSMLSNISPQIGKSFA